jgi:alkylhydroperoxidase family enzyme
MPHDRGRAVGGEPEVRLAGLAEANWNDEVRAALTAAVDNVRRATATTPAGDAGAPAGDPLPTLTLIAHQQHLLVPFLTWAGALAGRSELPRADAELVALRTAWLCRSLFEWREHRGWGAATGLDDGQLAAIADGAPATVWTERQRALLAATDELHTLATLTPSTWDALAAHLTPGERVEVVLVVGQYRMLSSLVNAAGTDAAIAPPGGHDPVGRRLAEELAGAPWLGSR